MSESAPVLSDERVKKEPFLTKLMKRPELGAIAGAVLVFVFFAITADESMFTLAGVMNFMTPAAQLGIGDRCGTADDWWRVRPVDRIDGCVLGAVFRRLRRDLAITADLCHPNDIRICGLCRCD